MAKTTAPLLSFDAAGQIGKTLVYSSWKGRPYSRRYVVPSNPNTQAQQATRTLFAGLQAIWRYLPAGALDAWDLYADNSRFTARKGWIKQNLPRMRGDSDLANLLMSVSAGAGIPPLDVTTTPQSGAFDVLVTPQDLPSGWTISEAYALAIENLDPTSIGAIDVGTTSDASDPYDMTITGLKPSTEYLVGGWLSYVKPDGSLAYAQSIQTVATTLA